jgi:NTP pyrophosphatase (non-canonical NTP hydrolase)
MQSKGNVGGAGLTLQRYFEQAAQTDRFKRDRQNFKYYVFGLFGEVGGILTTFKKERRDTGLSEADADFLAEEIGDSLWYLMHAADRANIAPNQLGAAAIEWLKEELHSTFKSGKPTKTFADLNKAAASIRPPGPISDSTFLRRLASHCGSLVNHSRSKVPAGRVIRHFGALLGLLAVVANRSKLSLQTIVQKNLLKIQDRWPGRNPKYIKLFDEGFKPHEWLPRKFSVEFVERKRDDMPYVVQSIRGVVIGDPLTDNNDKDDGYRYHDVFHLSYAVHLGWSPVIRALLKTKRKSDKKIDTNQDGARAIIIEEGIATWIFNYAHYDWFAKIEEGSLDFTLLKQVRKIVRGYEVDACPLWQWERAILNGMTVFKSLYENRGGVVTVDLLKRKLTYSTLRTKRAEGRR